MSKKYKKHGYAERLKYMHIGLVKKKRSTRFTVMVPLVLCHSSQKGIYILHHGRGIFAAQYILAAIIKLNKKTVARTAVIGKILAKVTFLEPAPISQESAAAANAYCTLSWRAQLHKLNISHI